MRRRGEYGDVEGQWGPLKERADDGRVANETRERAERERAPTRMATRRKWKKAERTGKNLEKKYHQLSGDAQGLEAAQC